MSIVQLPSVIAASPLDRKDWRPVILSGPYLSRMRCQLALDADGHIVDCDRIHSAFSGTARFGSWFTALYHPVFLEPRGFRKI